MWRLVLTVSLLCWSSEGRVTCRDNNNGEVDWFILYKEPMKTTQGRSGLDYVYYDSTGTEMTPSTPGYKNIKDSKGVLANTLGPLFSVPPNFGFISYSDQPPRGCNADSDCGHSKGVVMVEKDQTGIWLLHSTPKFPFSRDQNKFWPDTGVKNAQMFLCVTFPYKEFKKIGEHLQYIGAFPFDKHVPDDFHQELRDAANKVQRDPPKTYQLTSANGQIFRSFAKQQSEQTEVGDLYVTIAKEIRSEVKVQTWNCTKEPSYCVPSGYNVLNIETISTPLGEWNKCDHSKWCVATDQNKHWSCVADVNRAKSQYRRRGGALCIENERVQQIFLGFVKEFEDCKRKRSKRSVCDIDCQDDSADEDADVLNRAHLAGSDSEVRFFSVLFSVVLIYLF